MRTLRWLAVVAAALMVVAPTLADARAGGGTGSGSRGSRTNQAPAPTQTAPQAKPVERSKSAEQPAQKPGGAAATPAPRAGGFMARNPFLSGLIGGMLGAGLIGMLFGGGFGAGLAGAAGFIGLLLQVALIGGLVYLGVRLFRGWSAARAQPAPAGRPAYVLAGGMPGRTMDAPPLARSGGALPMGSAPQVAIGADDYRAFETALADIQAAWSRADLAALRGLATPEMVGYFAEELASNAGRGVENRVEAVKLEQGDLSEAWSEGNLEYATVAMRFSMIDTTRRIADGAIVAGNDKVRTEATEVWTFLRNRGGPWLLSAIQQT
ncbi:MAG: Tim44 domain-containing protein [Reyranella sp.]|uniref:Tim44 domain-containing protein n=1 Tax=Reyranella sp. TaxID=1929291 RepID=UPI003D11E810